MNKQVIEQWERRKGRLMRYFANTPAHEYYTYENLVKAVFTEVVTDSPCGQYGVLTESITKIDDGDYQGTQLFLIPMDKYQPDETDYYVTHSYYGSCSGCDALMGITEDIYNLPNEEQVKSLMTLALHIVQRTKVLYEVTDNNR